MAKASDATCRNELDGLAGEKWLEFARAEESVVI